MITAIRAGWRWLLIPIAITTAITTAITATSVESLLWRASEYRLVPDGSWRARADESSAVKVTVDVALLKCVLEVIVHTWHHFALWWTRIRKAITTTFIDDLILTNASITTSIRQTLSIVLTRARQTIIDHLFANGASISGLASARESRSRLRVFYALATILARERETNASL